MTKEDEDARFVAYIEFCKSARPANIEDVEAAFFAGWAAKSGKWVPIMGPQDLEQPPGVYWVTFVESGAYYVGIFRIYPWEISGMANQFVDNAVAYMKVPEPEPWKPGLTIWTDLWMGDK